MSVKKIYESDSAKDLWRYYDESEPLNVGMIGFTDCTVPAKGDYRVERKDCRFTALEYVREGKGIFKINGKEYRPCAGSVMVLTRGSDHSYYPDPRDPWKKDWIR